MTHDRARLTSLIERYLAVREQPQATCRAPREARAQLEMLEQQLRTRDHALDTAITNHDLPGTMACLAARVPIWLAMADLAEQVHPAYALACRVAASWERATADHLRTPHPATGRPDTNTTTHRPRPSLAELVTLERCAARGPGRSHRTLDNP